MYWSDWNRDAPKIEKANMDGTERSVFVETELGLPNGLTFDHQTQHVCWGDAGSLTFFTFYITTIIVDDGVCMPCLNIYSV